MSTRTIAIGDVHGCAEALAALVDAIQPTRDDTIVTLGDYIDRGPDSRRVIELLLELSQRCHLVPLIGNHEVMLLIAVGDDEPDGEETEKQATGRASGLEFWKQCGGAATLASYGGSVESIPREHVEFIRQCGLAYETETHIFVHANYDPELDLPDQDQHVALWRHLSMQVPEPHKSGKTAVVGHTPQMDGEILDAGHLVCIDTFCFGTGYLTAYDVATKTIWQADRSGTLRFP